MKSSLTSADFWKATIERSIRTFAQALVASGLAGASGVLDVDWGSALSVAALAFILTVLTCVASSGVGESGPALTSEKVTRDPSLSVAPPTDGPADGPSA